MPLRVKRVINHAYLIRQEHPRSALGTVSAKRLLESIVCCCLVPTQCFDELLLSRSWRVPGVDACGICSTAEPGGQPGPFSEGHRTQRTTEPGLHPAERGHKGPDDTPTAFDESYGKWKTRFNITRIEISRLTFSMLIYTVWFKNKYRVLEGESNF